jgi:hypothetical protein
MRVRIIIFQVAIGIICFIFGFAGLNFLQKGPSDSFFESQGANVNGQILKVSGQTILFKNNQKQTRQFILADKIAIMKPGQTDLPPLISSSIKDIDLNKDAGIVLKVLNGKYEVTTINYSPTVNLPQPPSYAPGSKQSLPTETSQGPETKVAPPILPAPPTSPPDANSIAK